MGEIILTNGEFYWVLPAYDGDEWIVARWDVGIFWGPSGREVSPKVIRGPIERPREAANG